jgi:hypothetical protein
MSRFASLVLLFPLVASADPDANADRHARKARELLELTGADAVAHQTLEAMLEQFRLMPGLPPGFVDAFREVAAEADFISMVAPIYVEELSESDIDAAIEYWKSPAGRRMAAATPTITARSMEVGQQWGQQLAARALERVGVEPTP